KRGRSPATPRLAPGTGAPGADLPASHVNRWTDKRLRDVRAGRTCPRARRPAPHAAQRALRAVPGGHAGELDARSGTAQQECAVVAARDPPRAWSPGTRIPRPRRPNVRPADAPQEAFVPETSEVLVAHSYFLLLDPKQAEKMKPYPPLATLLTAAVLRE